MTVEIEASLTESILASNQFHVISHKSLSVDYTASSDLLSFTPLEPPSLLDLSTLFILLHYTLQSHTQSQAIQSFLYQYFHLNSSYKLWISSTSMAETNPIPQHPITEGEEESLKYLELVQVTVLHAVLYAAKLYDYAKEKSGPLKPGVQSVEGTVKTVVGPVYDKYNTLPLQLLKFVDRKVDESVNKIESRVPPLVKQVSAQAISAAQKAPTAARSVASEVKAAGVMETASGFAKTVYTKYEPAAKELYTKYEPVAEQYAASAWRSLNKLPLVPKVAQAVAPTASYYSEKYNQTIQLSAEKGYRVASYLPLVPTEKIAKIISNAEPVVVSN